MKEKINKIIDSKSFHVCVIILIIAILLGGCAYIIIKYDSEGETNMPFNISKISIISSSEGIDKDAGENRWAFDVNQNNDVYLYVDKNDNYEKQVSIKSVVLDNFDIKSENTENIKIYKPDSNEEKIIFKYTDEDVVNELDFQGEVESNLKNLQISNQGGIVAFRCARNNITEYKSDEEEIKHDEILKKANITNESLKINLSFDMTLKLEDGKEFKTTIGLELPTGDVVNQGTTSTEITDTNSYIFKRIKNN